MNRRPKHFRNRCVSTRDALERIDELLVHEGDSDRARLFGSMLKAVACLNYGDEDGFFDWFWDAWDRLSSVNEFAVGTDEINRAILPPETFLLLEYSQQKEAALN